MAATDYGQTSILQCVPKRCIHKVNIPYYNVYTSFWATLYILINTITRIGVTFLDKLWDELEYRLDVCRTTSGSHIKHL
jgi:hypothetical protein